ncbi:hypothetical protein MES5069_160039 [Mesorhizobium escarrei]|uniref:Uncharacterized protein n=1 Tax=Mesorhizobium escarrei TaxID=666018 RepID=A0ABN8JMC7_9HYPH|nr:hypothetical protein MES5069_160039 [Mesorhizobium escarrei]
MHRGRSRRRKGHDGRPDRKEPATRVAYLAGEGKLSISIGRAARLEESIQLIADLRAGLPVKGKAVIVLS